MASDSYQLEFVRKTGDEYTHWELRCVDVDSKAEICFGIQGSPLNFYYASRSESGRGESTTLIANYPICVITAEQVLIVDYVASATPIRRASITEYERILLGLKKPWNCQDWTVAVLSRLENTGIVPMGISRILGTYIGEKGHDDFPDDPLSLL